MEITNTPTANRTTPAASSPAPLVLDIRPIFARGLSPCGTIDEAVASLLPRQSFVLLAPFEPLPLFTKLAAQGFDHISEPLPDGSWKISFERTREASGNEAAHQSCCCSH